MSEARTRQGSTVAFSDGMAFRDWQDLISETVQPASAALRRSVDIDRNVDDRYFARLLLGALSTEDLVTHDAFELAPKSGSDLPDSARRSSPQADIPTTAVVDVEVPDDSLSAVLTETNGVFEWHLPEPEEALPPLRGSAVRPGKRIQRFRIKVGSTQASDRRGLVDLLGGVLANTVRAYIVRWVAKKALAEVARLLEKKVRPGLISITSNDPLSWRVQDTAPSQSEVPKDRPARLLLLIHGTFSSSLGSFGALGATESGRSFLAQARERYDAIIAYDHKTLADTPEQNAQAICGALAALNFQAGSTIDIVSYSRGALIARVLVERLLERLPIPLTAERAVFVGGTNGGTALADQNNWKALLDLYTNLAVAASRGLTLFGAAISSTILVESVKALGGFVQAVVDSAITAEMVPGIAAMSPSSKLVGELNAQADSSGGSSTRYFAIGSNFDRTLLSKTSASSLPASLFQMLANLGADILMRKENDLVVDDQAMKTFGGYSGRLSDTLFWESNPIVFHTNYFAQAEVVDALESWLLKQQDSVFKGNRRPSEEKPRELPKATPPRRRGEGERLVAKAAPPAQEEVVCHFGAKMPETNALDRASELSVTVSREKLEEAIGPTSVLGEAMVRVREAIQLEVQAKRNCEVLGTNTVEEIRVPDLGHSEIYDFKIKGIQAGPAEVWVDARQGARRLARMVLQPVFVAISKDLSATTVVETNRPEKAVVELRIIEESADSDKYRLRFILQSPDLSVGSINQLRDLRRTKDQVVADFYSKMEGDWGRSGAEYSTFIDQVRTFGAGLFDEIFPTDIKRSLWENRDRIGCIQVISQEPSIPWELLFMVEPEGAISPEGRFLGELGLVRWVDNLHWPPSELRVRANRAFTVIPDYADPRLKLKGAAQERETVERLFNSSPINGTRGSVIDRLKAGKDIDLLHFACHGSASTDKIWNAALLMQGMQRPDGQIVRETLTLNDIRFNSDFKRDDNSRPIVFINACQAGITGETLTGTGGLAETFLYRGAGLFVSTLWSIGDDIAHSFSESFYENLKNGNTVAEAARSARQVARKANEPTWLAYTIYGHPYARLAN